MQATIGILFLIIVIAISAAFLWIGLNSRRKANFPAPIILSRIRRAWGITLGVVLAVLFAYSLLRLPYPWAKAAAPERIVEVQGFQFGWQMTSQQLPLGSTVEFRVTGKDVNHGFGVYSPGGRLMGQTQAMPGYTNRLILTFSEPGTYSILCLELCGVGHHVMKTTFEVR